MFSADTVVVSSVALLSFSVAGTEESVPSPDLSSSSIIDTRSVVVPIGAKPTGVLVMDVVASRGVAVSSREVVSILVVGTSAVVSIGAVVSK